MILLHEITKIKQNEKVKKKISWQCNDPNNEVPNKGSKLVELRWKASCLSQGHSL